MAAFITKTTDWRQKVFSSVLKLQHGIMSVIWPIVLHTTFWGMGWGGVQDQIQAAEKLR